MALNSTSRMSKPCDTLAKQRKTRPIHQLPLPYKDHLENLVINSSKHIELPAHAQDTQNIYGVKSWPCKLITLGHWISLKHISVVDCWTRTDLKDSCNYSYHTCRLEKFGADNKCTHAIGVSKHGTHVAVKEMARIEKRTCSYELSLHPVGVQERKQMLSSSS